VSASELSVKHGPVPWKGNQPLASSEISQIYCKTSKRNMRAREGSAVAPTLYAELSGDRRIKLLPMAGELETLLYLEQRLEERLGIRDAAIPGEYQG